VVLAGDDVVGKLDSVVHGISLLDGWDLRPGGCVSTGRATCVGLLVDLGLLACLAARSHKKIIATRITTPRRLWPMVLPSWMGVEHPQKSSASTITPTICTIVATRNPIVGVVGRGLADQAKLTQSPSCRV
jgi:hypothetical protein